MLSREDILGKDDLKREAVTIEEWGGDVFVRVMTSEEKEWWEAGMFDDEGKQRSLKDNIKNMRARLAVITVCDEQGTAVFHLNDVDLLTKKSSTALDKIWDVARRINKISSEEEAQLLKNSASVPIDASPSDLL